MELLEQRILSEGQVRPGNVLKVDCFLNHQLDVDLLDKLGQEFYRLYKGDGINKILTIEASGIAIACMTARYFNVPVVFAKKAKSKNIDGEVFTSTVHSFTYGKDYDITLSKKFLGPQDKVLILEGVILVAYTAADLAVFWHTGNEPATLTACVFGVCGFENGVMGWIKTTKEKQAAARTNGSGQTAAPVEPPTEREEPPDAGIK